MQTNFSEDVVETYMLSSSFKRRYTVKIPIVSALICEEGTQQQSGV